MNRYTNAVLTVIAIALVTLAIENGVTEVRAQSLSVSHTAICDVNNSDNCVRVIGGRLVVSQ